MMTNDYGEQPDELEQQQPTLPLLYLPIELAEEISMYFERRDAAKLLRVSRSFHSLFLPRVWVDLRTFTVIEDDEVKQHLLEKYGRFVRIIDLTYYVTSLFEFDRLSSVKRATCLKDSIHEDTTAGEAEMLIKLIKQSKMLQKLEFRFSKYDTPVKLDELASAINGLEYLKRIKIEFTTVYGAKNTENEWRHAAGFVDLLHPSKRSKLGLEMIFSTALNEAIVRTVSPYIVKLDAYGKGFCTTYLADAFFDIRDNDGQPLMFPQLKELEMTSCCFNRENYGIESIKASRFPQLQRLYFRTYSCDFERFGRPNEIEHEKRNWKPEYSSYAHIVVSSQRWQCLTYLHICIVSSSILMDIIDLNPQLQRLIVGLEYSDAPVENDASKYNQDEFQIDTILDRLPRLEYFSIGQLNSRIVVNPGAIPAARRYYIGIVIGSQMSITPSAVVYIMQMPRLTSVAFNKCVPVDMDETIRLLQGNDEKFQKLLKSITDTN